MQSAARTAQQLIYGKWVTALGKSSIPTSPLNLSAGWLTYLRSILFQSAETALDGPIFDFNKELFAFGDDPASFRGSKECTGNVAKGLYSRHIALFSVARIQSEAPSDSPSLMEAEVKLDPWWRIHHLTESPSSLWRLPFSSISRQERGWLIFDCTPNLSTPHNHTLIIVFTLVFPYSIL